MAYDLRSEYEQGHDAYKAGVPAHQNPYTMTPSIGTWIREWDRGWQDAEREANGAQPA